MENVELCNVEELIRFTISRKINLQLTMAFSRVWSRKMSFVSDFWHRGREEDEFDYNYFRRMLFDILFWHGMIHFPIRWRILPWCLMDWQSVSQDWLRTRGKKLILKDASTNGSPCVRDAITETEEYGFKPWTQFRVFVHPKIMLKHFNSFTKKHDMFFRISCALKSHFWTHQC